VPRLSRRRARRQGGTAQCTALQESHVTEENQKPSLCSVPGRPPTDGLEIETLIVRGIEAGHLCRRAMRKDQSGDSSTEIFTATSHRHMRELQSVTDLISMSATTGKEEQSTIHRRIASLCMHAAHSHFISS